MIVALIAILVVALMMCGARFGFWEPIVGFGLVRTYLNPIAYGVVGLGVLGLIYQLATRNSTGAVKAGIASLVGVVLLAPTIYGQIQPPVRYPPIHDISTDANKPPIFLVLDDKRAGAKNTLVYGGAEVAAQQKKTYPDIAPIRSDKSASAAYLSLIHI